MKALLVHNYYQQPGGEDRVFAAEAALLEARGHPVIRYTRRNDRLKGTPSLILAGVTLWNGAVYREARALIRRERPGVVHCHNIFPLISPSIYDAARAEGVPVVQTLHNYRLLCPNAIFFRAGRVCEDCQSRLFCWPAVVHACYRKSRTASGVVALMLAAHRLRRTWRDGVDVYIACSQFVREKVTRRLLPADKVAFKPNFLHAVPRPAGGPRDYALFVGRLSPEKGVETLLAAWKRMEGKAPLKIAGDGPLAPRVMEAAGQVGGVEWLGRRTAGEIEALMRGAAFLLFPSEWYENSPVVICEAFAAGTPVVASEIGAVAELVEAGRTGLHFRPGDADDLAAKAAWAWAHPERMQEMGLEARREYERKYTAEQSYRALMAIYEKAMESKKKR